MATCGLQSVSSDGKEITFSITDKQDTMTITMTDRTETSR